MITAVHCEKKQWKGREHWQILHSELACLLSCFQGQMRKQCFTFEPRTEREFISCFICGPSFWILVTCLKTPSHDTPLTSAPLSNNLRQAPSSPLTALEVRPLPAQALRLDLLSSFRLFASSCVPENGTLDPNPETDVIRRHSVDAPPHRDIRPLLVIRLQWAHGADSLDTTHAPQRPEECAAVRCQKPVP